MNAEGNIEEYETQIEEYEDYKDIVIEVDEKILKFISSFQIGSILSLEVLVGLANKYECEKCTATFYSKNLFWEHGEVHTSNTVNVEQLIKDDDEAGEEENKIVTDINNESDKGEGAKILDDSKHFVAQDEAKDQKLDLPFKCDICHKAFPRQSWLVRHRFSHRKCDKKEYSCFHCANTYASRHAKYSYTKHIDRLITAEEERVCDTCGFMANTVKFLQTHKQVKHLGLKLFKCEAEGCDKEFSMNKYLIKHKMIHNTDTSYQCSECGFTTYLKKNLHKHNMRQHVEKLTLNLNCEDCDYFAPNKDQLRRHKRNYHSGNINECSQCDKKYHDRGRYLSHIKRDHEGVRYKCEICDQEFTLKHTLETHIKRTHEGLKFKCENCDHEATSKRALRWHNKKLHEINPFSCDMCTFVGSSYPFLNSHKNKVHIGVRYHCDLCEHVLYNETILKDHMRQFHPDQEPTIHEHQKTTFNVEDYPRCEPCNKLFQTRKKFLNHKEEKHSDQGSQITEEGVFKTTVEDKPVKKKVKKENCPTCDNSFYSERRLERHMVMEHSALLPCTKCDDTFTDKKLFINHRNIHRREQDIETPCELCGKVIRSKSLAKHIQMFHSDMEP